MDNLSETVSVGGIDYVIRGIPFGQIPVWQMITKNGKELTGDEFMGLPDADKDALAAAVEKYIDKLNQG